MYRKYCTYYRTSTIGTNSTQLTHTVYPVPVYRMSGIAEERFLTSLDDFELHGWRPDPSISFDDNVMDLVMLVTRTSKCRQGSMACILVKPSGSKTNVNNGDDLLEVVRSSIVSVSTNLSLFKAKNSDVHAEIGALGAACRKGIQTEGCSAYITMPPCRACFGALVAAGIERIVLRMPCLEPVSSVAEKQGIELVVLGKSDDRTGRINTLIHGHPEGKKRDLVSDEKSEAKRQK